MSENNWTNRRNNIQENVYGQNRQFLSTLAGLSLYANNFLSIDLCLEFYSENNTESDIQIWEKFTKTKNGTEKQQKIAKLTPKTEGKTTKFSQNSSNYGAGNMGEITASVVMCDKLLHLSFCCYCKRIMKEANKLERGKQILMLSYYLSTFDCFR